MTASDPQQPESKRAFWLPILVLSLVVGVLSVAQRWSPYTWLQGDGSFYLNVTRGILEHGTLRQEAMHPHSWYDLNLDWNRDLDAAWSNIAIGRHGEWWPKHPLLLPLLALPFVWALGTPGTLVVHLLCFGLIGVFAYRIAAQMVPRPAALAATCVLVLTPWFMGRAWGFSNDMLYTAILLACIDAAMAGKPALAGALLGVGIFAKATNVLYGPAILAVFLLRKDWRGAWRMCLWAAGPTLAYLALNAYMFGSPLRTGYDRVLVKEAGKTLLHSTATDFAFNRTAMKAGLKQIVSGADGFWTNAPLLCVGLVGLLPLLLRRWRDTLMLVWCLAVPVLFHASYRWYRLDFNLPQLALAVVPLAAMLAPVGRVVVAPDAMPLPWRRLFLASAILIVGMGVVRRATAPQRSYFWRELAHAQVFLGDIPCDYYNNLNERWECASYDNNDWMRTGRPLAPALKFGNSPEPLLLFHAHTTGRERRIQWPAVPMAKTLHLRYGFADLAHDNVKVRFRVTIDGKQLVDEEIGDKRLRDRQLDTTGWRGKRAKVVFSVVPVGDANWAIFGFDGGPEDR